MAETIPFHKPSISDRDVDAVVEVLRSGWLTTGPAANRFEERFAEYVGAQYAVAVNSCTAALHLALAAAGVGPGDEVIVPTMTFTATAEVVVLLGADPVLVDVKADTLNLDPAAAKDAMSAATKALIPVHYGGQAADMNQIMSVADHHCLVIEDAAHALPTLYGGERVGSISDAACFSFYATKTITTGEGGMLTTDDKALADRVRSLSLHGLSNDAWNRFETGAKWDYAVLHAGYKYNMTDVAAALGITQLERADTFRDARARIADRYRQHFERSDLIEPLTVANRSEHAWHLYVVRLAVDRLRTGRNDVTARLANLGIGTSVHYRPLHLHPFYQKRYAYNPNAFPNATRAFNEIISLPIYPDLKDSEVDRVAESLINEVDRASA